MRIELTETQRLVDLQDGNLEDLKEAIASSNGVSAALDQCIGTHRDISWRLNNYAKDFAKVQHKAGTPEDVLASREF